MRLSPEIRAFLEERRFATLATVNEDGSPQQTVMWYEVRGDEIMMNTARGRRKDRNLVRDQRASICVEDENRYVVIEGTITLNDDQSVAQADIKALAVRYEGLEQAEKNVQEQYAKQERVTLILTPTRIVTEGF